MIYYEALRLSVSLFLRLSFLFDDTTFRLQERCGKMATTLGPPSTLLESVHYVPGFVVHDAAALAGVLPIADRR